MNGRPPVIVLSWPLPAPYACGLVHPHAAEFAAAGAPILPCSRAFGHTGVHCFESDHPDDEPDHPGTDRLLFEAAMLELAEHFDICDACGDRMVPLCFLGGLKLNAVMDHGQRLQDRQRGSV
jgi:hypothetical protein